MNGKIFPRIVGGRQRLETWLAQKKVEACWEEKDSPYYHKDNFVMLAQQRLKVQVPHPHFSEFTVCSMNDGVAFVPIKVSNNS